MQYSTRWDGFVQAARHIRTSYGILALFKGHSASLVRVFPYAGINFLAYEQFRAAIITSPEKEAPWRRFLCGSMAGATSTLITYPLELIRTRLAFEMPLKQCKRIPHPGLVFVGKCTLKEAVGACQTSIEELPQLC